MACVCTVYTYVCFCKEGNAAVILGRLVLAAVAVCWNV